jgi:hypothetical protein
VAGDALLVRIELSAERAELAGQLEGDRAAGHLDRRGAAGDRGAPCAGAALDDERAAHLRAELPRGLPQAVEPGRGAWLGRARLLGRAAAGCQERERDPPESAAHVPHLPFRFYRGR